MLTIDPIRALRAVAPAVYRERLASGRTMVLGEVQVPHPRFKTALILRCVDYPIVLGSMRRRVTYFVLRTILDTHNRHVQVAQRIFKCPWAELSQVGYDPTYLFKLQRVQCNIRARKHQ